MKTFWTIFLLACVGTGFWVYADAQPAGAAVSQVTENNAPAAPAVLAPVIAKPARTPAPISTPEPEPQLVETIAQSEPKATEVQPTTIAMATPGIEDLPMEPAPIDNLIDNPIDTEDQVEEPATTEIAQDDAQDDGEDEPTYQTGVSPRLAEKIAETVAEPAADSGDSFADEIIDNTAAELADAEEATETTPVDVVIEDESPDAEATAVEKPAFVKNDDGSLAIGDFKVEGAGTADSPYILPWDLLMSAARVYNPRLGLDKMPEWAEALNNKRVRVEGYLMLPLAGTDTTEMLAMFNQWDGCCIGLPPTPYDAIEVALSKPLDGDSGVRVGGINYGALEGTFKADPYLVSGFLLGLWLMEDATLLNSQETGGHF